MEKEIILDGFKYTLRDDGLYENVDNAAVYDTIKWGFMVTHAGMNGILIPYGDNSIAKVICTDKKYIDAFNSEFIKIKKDYPDALACGFVGYQDYAIGGLW